MTKIYNRLLPPSRQSFFLFGLRGVGKSTWAAANYAEAERIDLLDQALFTLYLARPDRFADRLRALDNRSWVVVDEIQRLPDLLNEVHRFIEEKKLRFVLLGSSARKLRRAGVNLLAGRAIRKMMYPLLPEELGNDFDLDAALQFGTLPVVLTSEEPAATLAAYADMYLREEVQAEAGVRNLAGFARFLPVAALFQGQRLNVAGLARDSGVQRSTVQGYVDILEDTLAAYRIPGYEARLRVKERKHPKLYWTDLGVLRAVKRQLATPAAEELGPLFEGWVANYLRAHQELGTIPYDEMCYWAPAQGNVEVDFLLRFGKQFVAIEVKAAMNYSAASLTGLRAIDGLAGLRRRILVYRGRIAGKSEDGIEILSLDEFLAAAQSGFGLK
jgi:predicted AAA+ superfamily ATPase